LIQGIAFVPVVIQFVWILIAVVLERIAIVMNGVNSQQRMRVINVQSVLLKRLLDVQD